MCIIMHYNISFMWHVYMYLVPTLPHLKFEVFEVLDGWSMAEICQPQVRLCQPQLKQSLCHGGTGGSILRQVDTNACRNATY